VALMLDELDVVMNLARPLPRAVRDDFLAAVEAAVQGRVHGPGLTYRTAVSLLPSYFRNPAPTHKPQHFNGRKFRAR
jgi:hypothetical protein